MFATCWIAAKYSSLEVVVRVLWWWWRNGFDFESVFTERMSFANVRSIGLRLWSYNSYLERLGKILTANFCMKTTI
jgi:hypothetical protein